MHDTITLVSPSASSIDGLAAAAWEDVGASFDRFCLMAGIASLRRMMEEDAEQAAGSRHGRDPGAPGHRWGTATGTLGFQGGRVAVERPRVRDKATGREIPLPSWEEFRDRGHLDQWAASLMLASVSTRKFGRALRHPETGVPAGNGSGLSRSAVSRRFKALTEEKFEEWMSSDLSHLDILVIPIDGLHLSGDLLMIGEVGVDSGGKCILIRPKIQREFWKIVENWRSGSALKPVPLESPNIVAKESLPELLPAMLKCLMG